MKIIQYKANRDNVYYKSLKQMILTPDTGGSSTATNSTPQAKSFPKVMEGPANSLYSEELEYKLTEYTYKLGSTTISNPTTEQQALFDADKENITWVFWVSGGMMDNNDDYIVIRDRDLKTESETDFTNETDKSKFKDAVAENGYLEATVETTVEGGTKINKLTVKWSKWLDGKKVFVETFRGSPDHNATKDYVVTTDVKAQVEVLDVYWVNSQLKRITATGYETDVFLVFESLGLHGATMSAMLFDDDLGFSSDDALLWNGGSASHTFMVNNRKVLVPYEVEAENSANYANGHGDDLDPALEVFITLDSTEPLFSLIEEDKYAEIIFTPDVGVKPYMATKSTVTEGDTSYVVYDQVEKLLPGEKAFLVAECTNIADDTDVSFTVTEDTPLLVSAGQNIPFLIGNTETTVFTAKVKDGYAAIEIQLQKPDTTKYNDWVSKVMPTSGNEQEVDFEIKATVDSVDYLSTDVTKMVAPKVIQRIYHDGKISQEKYIESLIKKVQFIYHDNSNTETDLGTFDVKWAQKWVRGSKTDGGSGWKKIISGNETRYYQYDGSPGVKKTPIVSIFDTSQETTIHKVFTVTKNGSTFIRISENSTREYFNPERLAAFIGAVIETGYEDVTLMGSVDTDASGAYSVTHVNGNNMDLRWLRSDEKRPKIDTLTSGGIAQRLTLDVLADRNEFDHTRMNTLINALHKFGWAREKDSSDRYFLGWKYGTNADQDLDRTTQASHHQHHLHIQGFVPQYN